LRLTKDPYWREQRSSAGSGKGGEVKGAGPALIGDALALGAGARLVTGRELGAGRLEEIKKVLQLTWFASSGRAILSDHELLGGVSALEGFLAQHPEQATLALVTI
jgi:hypothetical protein